ncbi:MAG: homoserine kinase [Alphaproteobacteria bacterium]
MAVYTDVSADDLKRFVAGFDIGDAVSLDGIAQGIENSNFRLRTTSGLYVLTLYEKRVNPADLPFFLGLMRHLVGTGIRCPAPVADRNGELLHELSGRPAAIVRFAPGDWPRRITPAHCRAVGIILGKLHIAAAGFPMTRDNDQSLKSWRAVYSGLGSRADELRQGFADWIETELTALESGWPEGLPAGIIHGDLFPDNVFFEGDAVSGIIDFYFACNDALAFDLAICLNAWCFENGALDRQRARAMCAGYEFIRPLEPAERDAFPLLARGAAMRFLATRLHDWFHTPQHALTQRKDPLEFVPVIECHRAVSDSTAYGVG